MSFNKYVNGCVLVGFDIDGTLVCTLDRQAISTSNFLKSYGVEQKIDGQWIKAHIYPLTTRERIDYLQNKFGLEIPDKNKAFDMFQGHSLDAEIYASVYDGTVGVLNILMKHGKKIAFITSASNLEVRKNIEMIEDAMGESLKIPVITIDHINHDEINSAKPHWRPMEMAYEMTGIEPGKSVYIGDTENDMVFVGNVNEHYGRKICAACFVENTFPIQSLKEDVSVDFAFKNTLALNEALKEIS